MLNVFDKSSASKDPPAGLLHLGELEFEGGFSDSDTSKPFLKIPLETTFMEGTSASEVVSFSVGSLSFLKVSMVGSSLAPVNEKGGCDFGCYKDGGKKHN